MNLGVINGSHHFYINDIHQILQELTGKMSASSTHLKMEIPELMNMPSFLFLTSTHPLYSPQGVGSVKVDFADVSKSKSSHAHRSPIPFSFGVLRVEYFNNVSL